MGCDNTNTLSKEAKKKDVQDFLEVLGYKKYSSNSFFFFDKKSREQISGVSVKIVNTSPIQVHTHTTSWRSIKDHEIHNWTIKQLKKRFGGHFDSDNGKNRYLTYGGVVRRKAESGCELAYIDFSNNIALLHGFLSLVKNNESKFQWPKFMNPYNPLITSTNIGLPYLISVMEDYLRSTYISLLTYSPNKRDILRKSNINTEELFEVAENNLSIEEVISSSKSFQNINLINKNFKEIRNDLNFIDTLKRNNPRRKFDIKLDQIVNRRHDMIHKFQMDHEYNLNEFARDIDVIVRIVQMFYDRIIEIHEWSKRDS